MKAPEKIYIQIDDTINFISQVFTRKPVGGTYFRDVEYIRKDALLEWAKERREAVAKEVVIREGVRLGADAAFEELIDKLNEM